MGLKTGDRHGFPFGCLLSTRPCVLERSGVFSESGLEAGGIYRFSEKCLLSQLKSTTVFMTKNGIFPAGLILKLVADTVSQPGDPRVFCIETAPPLNRMGFKTELSSREAHQVRFG